jgi:hypothetical protein
MGTMMIDISDAVVAELNGAPAGTFAQTFTAVRHYRPQFDLAELKTLQVSVVPKAIAITGLMRSANQHDVSVDVAVQKKVTPPPEGAAELDGLMTLVEQIGDYLRLRRLTALPGALWTKTDNVPVYAPEHLEQKQVFTSVLTFTFRVVR